MTTEEIDIISNAKNYIKTIFKDECTGHDIYHTIRVYKMAMNIQKQEGGDEFIISIASLLHDVDDYKLNVNKSDTDPFINARTFMIENKLDSNLIEKIIEIINSISYKGNETISPKTLEGQIVQDADRLDAIGAIGIARVFAYGGHKNSPIYDPNIKSLNSMDFNTYKNHRSTSINHFYEKLLKLKDLMNTNTAKKIAEQRHKYMEEYLTEFYKEWNLD